MTFGNNKWTTERDHIDLQSFKDIVRSITKLLKPWKWNQQRKL